jgi:hypothetical protein
VNCITTMIAIAQGSESTETTCLRSACRVRIPKRIFCHPL